MHELEMPERVDVEPAFEQERSPLVQRDPRHDVQLAPGRDDLVEEHDDVSEVSSPAAKEDVLTVSLDLRRGRRGPCNHFDRHLGLVRVVVLGEHDEFVVFRYFVRRLGVEQNSPLLPALPHSDGHRVWHPRRNCAERQPREVVPLLHVKLVAFKPEHARIHRGKTGLTNAHQHQPSDDVVAHHRLYIATPDELHERLRINVAHLRNDVPLQLEVTQIEYHLQDFGVRLIRLELRVAQHHDRSRLLYADLHQIRRHHTRP
mmetsp:Transcript_28874/g.94384  ORF Transcript_28874/g.94384 Transcript_28874/m.94384 type:complete len:259 (-) Transcript_28874:872-1648(-)